MKKDVMKILVGMLIVMALLLICGCEEQTQENKQRRKQTQDDGLSGTWQDIDKGMSFTLVEVERSEGRLKFIVPFGGEDEEDNVVFDLRIEGYRLEGIGYQVREGSEKFPITFIKK